MFQCNCSICKCFALHIVFIIYYKTHSQYDDKSIISITVASVLLIYVTNTIICLINTRVGATLLCTRATAYGLCNEQRKGVEIFRLRSLRMNEENLRSPQCERRERALVWGWMEWVKGFQQLQISRRKPRIMCWSPGVLESNDSIWLSVRLCMFVCVCVCVLGQIATL